MLISKYVNVGGMLMLTQFFDNNNILCFANIESMLSLTVFNVGPTMGQCYLNQYITLVSRWIIAIFGSFAI